MAMSAFRIQSNRGSAHTFGIDGYIGSSTLMTSAFGKTEFASSTATISQSLPLSSA